MTESLLAGFTPDGYAVARGLFDLEEVERLGDHFMGLRRCLRRVDGRRRHREHGPAHRCPQARVEIRGCWARVSMPRYACTTLATA